MSNSVNLSLDVTKTGIQNPLIKVRQGDGGFETLHTTVTSNGEPMDLQGWTITFMGTTAGNHKIVDGNVKVVEAPNGIFDYTPSKAWGMDIGEFKIAYFKFVKGDGSASSANFRVSVIEAVDLTQAEAKNYISVVDTTIATINQHLNDSLANVTKSIADANANANTVASNVNSLGNRVDDYNNKLAAVQVGGRNLLLNTSRSFTGIGTNAVNGSFNAQGGEYFLAGGKKVSDLYNQYGPTGYLTISFDWVASGDTLSGQFNPQWSGTPWYGIFAAGVIKVSDTNKSGHYESSVKLDYAGYDTGKALSVMFRQDNLQGNVTISNVKLEAGNIATDWTPAPEDAPSNDAQLVHKTGTETIAGDKTFTSPINGQLSGNAATATKWQTARTLALTGDVTGSVSIDGSNNVSIATTGANLVHKTGAETIAGDKTFTNNVNVGGTLNSSKQYLEIGTRVKSADKSGVTSMWFGWQVYWTIRNGYATYQIRPTSTGTITPNSKSAEKLPVEACPLYKVFVPLRWGGQGFSINTDGTFENDTGVNIDPNASWSTAVSATTQGW